MNAATDNVRFGGAKLQQSRRVVADATGRETVLRAKSYEVLTLLLSRPDTVVTKDELFEKIWNGAAVTEDTLVQCITEIRKAIGARGHEALKTITKVGYRLVPDAVAATTVLHNVGHPLPQLRQVHPRGIAVLPFTNLGGDDEQDFLAEGLAEDVITDLSTSPDLFVIARHSSFSYRHNNNNLDVIASELGVRYLVEGSIRKSGDRLRITARLIDAQASGSQVWAERFESAYKDMFDVQDEISKRVVEAILGHLSSAKRYERLRPRNLRAYEFCVRGRNLWTQSKSANQDAIVLFKQALALERDYGEAHWRLGLSYLFSWLQYQEPRDKYRRLSLDSIKNAKKLDANDPGAKWAHGFILEYENRWEEAREEFQTSIAMNPNDPDARSIFSDFLFLDGNAYGALESSAIAMGMNPQPVGWHVWLYGQAQIACGRYEEAIASLTMDVTYRSPSRRILAVALALAGRREEATLNAEAYLATDPNWKFGPWMATRPFQKPQDVKFWVDGYRLAGFSE